MGITPNIVTTIGLLGNLAAAVIFGYLIAVIFKPKEKK